MAKSCDGIGSDISDVAFPDRPWGKGGSVRDSSRASPRAVEIKD